jgi:polyphosphate glucokinase
MTYDDYIGEKALEKLGKKKWNKRMEKVIRILKTVFNYDHLYLVVAMPKNMFFIGRKYYKSYQS